MTSEYCTAADVLERLRLTDTHPDALYVADCTTAACELIDDRLGYPDDDGVTVLPLPPFERRLWRAAVGVAIDIYRYKDREADTSGTWANAPAPPPRIPNNVLDRYDALLAPSRHFWGIG
jgi:hypothetical protein